MFQKLQTRFPQHLRKETFYPKDWTLETAQIIHVLLREQCLERMLLLTTNIVSFLQTETTGYNLSRRRTIKHHDLESPSIINSTVSLFCRDTPDADCDVVYQ